MTKAEDYMRIIETARTMASKQYKTLAELELELFNRRSNAP